MTTSVCPSYAGYRFPAEVISHAVWLYFRFPLSLRMVEEMLAARGIIVSHETVRQWARKFGQDFANQIRRRLPMAGDKWHLDEVAIKIAGKKHWLWRAVDQDGTVLDILVQSRRDKRAAKRLLRKLLKKQMRPPRVLITDKLPSYGEAKGEVMRTTDEAVQISRPSAAFPLRPRSDQQPLFSPPRPRPCRSVSRRPGPGLSELGRGHRRGRFGIASGSPSPSCAHRLDHSHTS